MAALLLGFVTDITAGNNTAVATIAILLTSYVLLYRWQLVKADPDEPPIIPSAVPFVGHLLGMALQGGRYVKNLGLRHPDKPIFTLPVPRSRMYVVTDPSLAAAVQRASKTLSFTPLVPDITQRVLGLDGDTVAIVRQHIDPEPGEARGFLADIHDLVYSYFGPGEALSELSLGAVRELAREVEGYVGRLQREKGGEETVDLLQWIRHFVAMATANLLYGEENPLALHPELESAFWDFDHGLGSLLMGVFPSITAGKAYRGREALAAALEEYLLHNRHLPGDGRKGASLIVQKRVAIALQHGWTLRATARSELSFLFAGIVNTATTTFWMVLYLFASASSGDTDNLLSTIRSELSSSLTFDTPTGTPTLSMDKLRTSSPALQSLFRECLRQNSDTYSTRLVKSATTLPGPAGPYHLAASSVVQISGGTMHADPRIWGADVGAFKPSRFLPQNQQQQPKMTTTTTTPNQERGPETGTGTGTRTSLTPHPASFRAFGGGKTHCPGRHFASTTIQAFVALLVTHFDITGQRHDNTGPQDDNNSGGGGRTRTRTRKIPVPEKEDGVLPVHVLEPKGEVRVTVRLRNRGGARGVAVVN
ncbi:cholesterol 7-alpha-monooxygenase [Parachaetomium inaequale]|uniref:Cholesterol 7-alpha-monooxygenase n=1 Tax=Parachaetomium inaequale TaxID=2588326 RepID=A0AAN6PTF9_9PEZI|nr:cholesterol 7-alpha-monooxygenase [Parachaetomium inaequale]